MPNRQYQNEFDHIHRPRYLAAIVEAAANVDCPHGHALIGAPCFAFSALERGVTVSGYCGARLELVGVKPTPPATAPVAIPAALALVDTPERSRSRRRNKAVAK